MALATVSCGIDAFDEIIQGLRLGDNVVWQVDRLRITSILPSHLSMIAWIPTDVLFMCDFAEHPPVLPDSPDIETIEVDPSSGFDNFSRMCTT